MEQLPNSGPEDRSALNQETDAEILGLYNLPETLGFAESPELSQLRSGWVEAMLQEGDQSRKYAIRYHETAQNLVDEHPDETRVQAQIGLIIQMGLIRRNSGRYGHFMEDLTDAHTYALNAGFDELANILELALEKAGVEHLVRACSEVLTEEDGTELLEMPLDEATGYAFTLLIENGIEDPEEYLRGRGFLE